MIQTQSFDSGNIVFAGLGIGGTILFATALQSERKRNELKTAKKLRSNSNMSNSDKTLDDGAGSRSESRDGESKNISSFSWRKWILLPLLFTAIILCGYFALPTTKSVAVSTPTKQITKKLIIRVVEAFLAPLQTRLADFPHSASIDVLIFSIHD